MTAVCDAEGCTERPRAARETCGSQLCDGNGACLACLADTDCSLPGQPGDPMDAGTNDGGDASTLTRDAGQIASACMRPSCSSGTCGRTFLPAGTVCGGTSIPSVCDGAGFCGPCTPNAGRCATGGFERCDTTGHWVSAPCTATQYCNASINACENIACKVQNLVTMVGAVGAHGYASFLFPHPDIFAATSRFLLATPPPGDSGMSAAFPFVQNTNNGGTPLPVATVITGNVDFNNMPLANRFQRVYGVDNQAFGGYSSADTLSRASDTAFWGSATVPSNAALTNAQRYIVVSPLTPWYATYGMAKVPTVIDGGGINPFHVASSNNAYVDATNRRTAVAAAATIQKKRGTYGNPVVIMGDLEQPFGGGSTVDFYNAAAVTGAPAPSMYSSAAAAVTAIEAARALPAGTLAPTAADRVRYGFTGSSPNSLAEMRDRLIVAAKLLKLDISSEVIFSYMNDDPHASFTAGGDGAVNAAGAGNAMRNFMNAFEDELMAVDDPRCSRRKLGDNTAILMMGDVPRTNVLRDNWNDPTTGGQNRTYVLSNGTLKTGFFGGDRPTVAGAGAATNNHTARGPGEGGLWDLTTGDMIAFDAAGTTGNIAGSTTTRLRRGETALAAALYAVSRGDMVEVNKYYAGSDFPALKKPVLPP